MHLMIGYAFVLPCFQYVLWAEVGFDISSVNGHRADASNGYDGGKVLISSKQTLH